MLTLSYEKIFQVYCLDSVSSEDRQTDIHTDMYNILLQQESDNCNNEVGMMPSENNAIKQASGRGDA